jgi:hypothetical protein
MTPYKTLVDYTNLFYTVFSPVFSNPVIEYMLDMQMDMALKMYYWPAFVAGNMDNWTDIVRPYNICRPYK